ncbi:MAG: sulfotransferase family protein [Elusimicrobiota bacterium]
MEPSDPIFIVGTERSGSNLLRLILNQHPSIAIPHPPHILKEMMPLEPLYGDLAADRNFKKLIGDVLTLVKLHFYPWDGPLDADAVFAEAVVRNVYGVKAALYDQYRRAKGKRRWGCKSTFVIRYVDVVRRHHPHARFIHLVRDGRDVAASAKRSVFNRFHPYYVGRLWAEQQRAAAVLAGNLPTESLLALRYEDLLDDPAREVRRVCGFLGEDYSDSLLEYFAGDEAKSLARRSRSWENCDKPVLRGNRAKYKTQLSAEEIEIFERQAFAELKAFGYALENDEARLREESGRGLAWTSRLAYWSAENAMMVRETAAALLSDRNAVRRLEKAAFVLGLRLRLAAGVR